MTVLDVPTPTITQDIVADFLAGLGTTADEVAASLRRMGVTGVRFSSTSCPIATAMRTRFPGFWEVCATTWALYGSGYAPVLTRGATPPPVRAFIRDFDNLCYADLVR